MARIRLIRQSPKTLRSLSSRGAKRTREVIEIASQFGFEYFDGSREFGYGGYVYDGRWKTIAKEICEHYGIKSGDKVLDVGCAKGFLVKDLRDLNIDCYGVDISNYAIANCHPDVKNYVRVGDSRELNFRDGEFDLVLSINTLHNLKRNDIIKSLSELMRVSQKSCFVQVDSYITTEEKSRFEEWVLTARFHDYPSGWLDLFKEAGYFGDWDWTVYSET